MERIFYDGQCGLCHRTVRFVLARDRAGVFRFAPLDSEAFRRAVPEEKRAVLPDSIVVETADGRLLVQSAAILHILRRLDGLWRVLGAVGFLVPRPIRDLAYNVVAWVRRRLFARPDEACPLVPKHLRERFDY